MHKFVRGLVTEWRRLELPLSGTAVVAVSGGADSCALLLGMQELCVRKKSSLRLIVAHFNHRLRGGASDADQEIVRGLAVRLGLESVSGAGTIVKRGNLEQNARQARYAFLQKIAKKYQADLVLTGHTINDQAETFLLNLIRGSGPDGLAAMPPVRSFDQTDKLPLLARPMLRWAKRADTEAFCREHQQEYARDEMNDDPAFTRVRIRKTLLPMLAGFNPKIVEALAATASLMPFGGECTPSATSDQGSTLSVAELKTLERHDLRLRLRAWLRSRRGSLRGLELKHIEAIEHLILSRKSGKTAQLPGRQTVSKSGGSLVFTEIRVEN